MTAITIDWFEIPVSDVQRASAFYGEVLGADIGSMDGPNGPMTVFLSPDGPQGAFVEGEGNAPSRTGPLLYFGSDDIDGALGRAARAGGEIVLTKTPIGPFGHIAELIDTEGNRVALHTGA